MYKSVCLTILCLSIIIGCVTNFDSLIQAGDSVIFGYYKFSPPTGYWYFQRKFPQRFDSSKDIFLITFYKDKSAIPDNPPKEPTEVFFNFAVSENKHSDFKSYYAAAKSAGVTYELLPEEAKILEGVTDWSCKYLHHGLHGIECVSLRDNLITIGAFGSNKIEVLSKAPILKKMMESFTNIK